jgi:hypothetical protein
MSPIALILDKNSLSYVPKPKRPFTNSHLVQQAHDVFLRGGHRFEGVPTYNSFNYEYRLKFPGMVLKMTFTRKTP